MSRAGDTPHRSARNSDFGKPRFTKAYGFAIVTGLFFLVSWSGQFVTQLLVEQGEAEQHGQSFEWSQFFAQFFASTFENWQSEFLQLLWQVVGLAYFLYVGSPSSKENDDRMEAKLDALIRINAGEAGDKLVNELDHLFARHHGHADPFAHQEETAQNAGKGIQHPPAGHPPRRGAHL